DRNGAGPDRNGAGPDRNGAGPDRNGAGPDRNGAGPDRDGAGPVVNGGNRVATPVLRLTRRPEPLRRWLGSLWRHRGVLLELSKEDFRGRDNGGWRGGGGEGGRRLRTAAVMDV